MKLKDIKENGILIYRDMIVDKSEISEVNEHVKSKMEDADFVYVGNNQYYEQSTYEIVFKVNEQLKDKLNLCSLEVKESLYNFFSQLKPREGQSAHSDQWMQIKIFLNEKHPEFIKDTSAFLSLFENNELMLVLEKKFTDKVNATDNKYSDAVKYLIKEELDCLGYSYNEQTIDNIYSEIMKDDAISTIFNETIINLLNRYTNSETEVEDIEISVPLKYPDEIKNKQIAEKVINTFEDRRLIEHKGYIYDVFVGDGQKSTYTYDDLLEFFTEEGLEAIKKNSYSEVISDWDISIIIDMNDLGIYDENSNYNFYLSKEELCYLGLKQILVDMGCNELDGINENRQDENSLDDFDYEISM